MSAPFGGYAYANLYPNWGSGVDQTMETTPESDEQAAYSNIDELAVSPVDSNSKRNIILLFVGVIIIIGLFSKG